METNVVKVPIEYSLNWENASLSMPEIKEQEAKVIDALIQCVKHFGATDVDVDSFFEDPSRKVKTVILAATGNLDVEQFNSYMRRLTKGFE